MIIQMTSHVHINHNTFIPDPRAVVVVSHLCSKAYYYLNIFVGEKMNNYKDIDDIY